MNIKKDYTQKKSIPLTGRAKLRGKILDDACRKAKISTFEYGINDNRKFCYGVCDEYPDEISTNCKTCGAYCMNATPLTN